MLFLMVAFLVQAQETGLEPKLIEGHFKSQGRYEILSQQRNEVVQTETEAGQKRLSELLNAGYRCHEISSKVTNCVRSFSPIVSVNPALDLVVKEKWTGQIFSFYHGVGQPKLITNTEFFKQWIVPQKVVHWAVFEELEKSVWNPVSYAWLQGDWSVYLGKALEPDYFPMLISKDRLQLSDDVEIQNGSNSSIRDRYFLQIQFQQVKK